MWYYRCNIPTATPIVSAVATRTDSTNNVELPSVNAECTQFATPMNGFCVIAFAFPVNTGNTENVILDPHIHNTAQLV